MSVIRDVEVFMHRSSSSGLNSSARTSGHLADVLSKVSASDFRDLTLKVYSPKLGLQKVG